MVADFPLSTRFATGVHHLGEDAAEMNRREFLGAAIGAGVAISSANRSLRRLSSLPTATVADSVLHAPARECPIDTVVVVMMENRSFDHYLGWLGSDVTYLEAGRQRYGAKFGINARVDQHFRAPDGGKVRTREADAPGVDTYESRGCTFRDPGHSWSAARLQRDHGFLAPGSGNDQFALTYYSAKDMPVYAALARRFMVFDQWHSSLLGPTFPNRQYLLSAQSEGRKGNPGPMQAGVFHAETIVDRLGKTGVPVGYYYSNVPLLALWGVERMAPYIRSLDRYWDDAASGRLPQVTFVEPKFGGGDNTRTDDHPRGDVGMGQRWIREVFGAFVNSPHWQRGAFVVVYDEGGGFFDHVRPPVLPDNRASPNDQQNFGQAGFRVPALLASPYAAPGAVDHRLYDHTSIMRFLEWRFLGAPPEGQAGARRWALTLRDSHANNMGATLRASGADANLGFDLGVTIPQPSPACTPTQRATRPVETVDLDPFDRADLQDLAVNEFPRPTHKPWFKDVTVSLK
jgi:phospholipase C